MKRQLLGFLLMSGIVLQCVCPVWAQQTDPIGQAKAQLRLLEAVEKDPTASPEAKSLNRRFLRERRLQLQALLTKAIAGLRDYQARVKSSLTVDENEAIENSIRNFEGSLQELNESMRASNSSDFPANEVTAVERAATTHSVPTAVRVDNASLRTSESDLNSGSIPAVDSSTNRAINTSPGTPAAVQANDCLVPIPTGGLHHHP